MALIQNVQILLNLRNISYKSTKQTDTLDTEIMGNYAQINQVTVLNKMLLIKM